MTKYALFDLDDTLLDFKNPMMEAIHEETGKNIHWSKWTSYNLLETYDISMETLFEILTKHECLLTALPFPLSKHILDKVRKLGYTICLVTARGWSPESRELTEEWLKHYDFPYDELIVTQVGDNKVDSLKHIEYFDFAIDDNHENCEHFATSGKFKDTFMMSAPWNMKECLKTSGIKRIYSLNDFDKMKF